MTAEASSFDTFAHTSINMPGLEKPMKAMMERKAGISKTLMKHDPGLLFFPSSFLGGISKKREAKQDNARVEAA